MMFPHLTIQNLTIEIYFQHSHLSMLQMHAAFSYYYAYQAEFDAEIERQLQEFDHCLPRDKRGSICTESDHR